MFAGRILCLIALFALSGMDRCFVQSFAWSTMLADRSPERGFIEAVNSTFNGLEPCHICESLAEAEQENPIAPAAEELPKLYSPASSKTGSSVIPPNSNWVGFSKMNDLCSSPELEIATPPPRLG